MSIIIRKITKKTILSFLGMGGLIFVLIGRFLPRDSRLNLNQLESKAKQITLSSGLIGIANADSPSSTSSSSSTGEGDSTDSTDSTDASDCDEGNCS